MCRKAEILRGKPKWDLIAVEKGERLINMDSQIPNQVVREWIEQGNFAPDVTLIRPETVYGSSRFDLYVEAGDRKIFIEVKGVTLEEDGVCRFPDAPSDRAVKHLEELIRAGKEGYETCVFFCHSDEGCPVFYTQYRYPSRFLRKRSSKQRRQG